MNYRMNRIIWLLVLLVGAPCALVSQVVTGSIQGIVKDSSGAVVPNATITVTNIDKNVVIRTTTTNSVGEYSALLLPVGHYSITADAKGFQEAVRTGVSLNVNDHLTENFSVQVGNVNQKVTVTTAPLQVDLQTAQAQTVITSAQVHELSLSTRNYEQLVTLMPGVVSGASQQLYVGVSNPNGGSNAVQFSMNGQRSTQNGWNVDGADNLDRGANLTLLVYPSVDAIQEFSVQRGDYGAEYGRSSGGQINVITKSGTDKFHGDLYEFIRNNSIGDANNYFNNQAGIPLPALRYNDFGGTIGGPIIIPKYYNPTQKKSFFFFSEESRRVITYTTFTAVVPTANERKGIFPQEVCIQFDQNGNCLKQGTQVTNFDPAAQAYMKDIFAGVPLPAPSCTQACESITVGRNIFNADQEILRLDQVFSPRFSIFGRVENDSIPTIEPGGLFTGSPLENVSTTSTNSPGVSATIHVTNVFSPTLLNDGGANYSQGGVFSKPIGEIATQNSPDIVSAVKLPFVSTLNRVPSLNFQYFSGVGGFGPYRDINDDTNIFDDLTKIVGRHTLKFGVTYNWYQKDEDAASGNAGGFGFYISNPDDTNAATASSEYQEFASFLTGSVDYFTQTSLDMTAVIQQQSTELYAQDQFRIRPNLTLNYGLRYSLFRQPTDHRKQLTNFDPAKFSLANAPQIDPYTGNIIPGTGTSLDGIIIGSQNSPYGNAVAQQDNKNFAPRIGLAWDPTGQGKISVRLGYGIFYNETAVSNWEETVFNNPPFVDNDLIFNTTLNNPGAVSAYVGTAPVPLRSIEPKWKTPYTQEWSLDVQQQLTPNTIFDLGYYGSSSTHLPGMEDINQPLPGQYVTALAPYGVTIPVSYTTTPQLNYIRPYRGYDAINSYEPVFSGNYNSLQASLQQHFKKDSFLNINYTWSQALTDATGDGATPQNTYDPHAEYGPSGLDIRNVFNANYVYLLPFYEDQAGVLGHLLGGWEVSGIVNAYSGFYATVYQFFDDPAGQGVIDGNSFSAGRPDQISNPNKATATSGKIHTFNQWFNTSAFALVPAGQARPGNAHNGSVIGPGWQNWDVSLFKNTNITNRVSTQFRAETYNTFNHVNPTAFGTAFQIGLYGQVYAVQNPRVMQLAMKLYF